MKPIILVCMILVVAPVASCLDVWGIDVTGVELQSSVWSIQNAVGDGAPDPIVNTIGASVPFRFSGRWLVRPEIQVFFLGYKFQGGRAVPESSEWDNITILSLMINPVGGYEFPITQDLTWTAEGGLGFLARFPVFANGKTAGDWALPVPAWLLAGRLFYPNIGTSLAWQFSPLFAATLRGQLYYPIFNLWNGLPWYDELTYGLGVGVRFTF